MKKITSVLVAVGVMLNTAFLSAQGSQGYYMSGNTTNYSTARSPINWVNSYADAVAQSKASSKPIVILFTGTGWCPACIKLEREVLGHPEFTSAVGDRFVFLKAEFPDYNEDAVMRSPYKPLLDRYNVAAFPTLVVINSNGEKLYTVNYKPGGPGMYAQELLQKLNTSPSGTPQKLNNEYYR